MYPWVRIKKIKQDVKSTLCCWDKFQLVMMDSHMLHKTFWSVTYHIWEGPVRLEGEFLLLSGPPGHHKVVKQCIARVCGDAGAHNLLHCQLYKSIAHTNIKYVTLDKDNKWLYYWLMYLLYYTFYHYFSTHSTYKKFAVKPYVMLYLQQLHTPCVYLFSFSLVLDLTLYCLVQYHAAQAQSLEQNVSPHSVGAIRATPSVVCSVQDMMCAWGQNCLMLHPSELIPIITWHTASLSFVYIAVTDFLTFCQGLLHLSSWRILSVCNFLVWSLSDFVTRVFLAT